MVGIVNRKRQERLDRLNAVEMINSQGKLGYTLGEMFGMGLASKNKLKPTQGYTPSQSQNDMKWKFRALQRESSSKYYLDRDMMLKENYIRTLKENYRSEDISEVIRKIREMNPDEFVLKFEAKGDAFEMAYPPDEEQYNAYKEELNSFWLNDSILDLAPSITQALLRAK